MDTKDAYSQENPELKMAEEYVKYTSKNIFLTGKAGTGKTTFLKRIVKESNKRSVVVAPTGVAALNAGGVTIHSFFQLPFGMFIPDGSNQSLKSHKLNKNKLTIIRSLELLIIDEVSMVRADLMDEIDNRLKDIRRNPLPFGGVQLLMIGDMLQLPPVVKEAEWSILSTYYASPYFFDAQIFKPKNLEQRTPGSSELETPSLFQNIDSQAIDNTGQYNNAQHSTSKAHSAHAMQSHCGTTTAEYVCIALKHIYRQQDADFIEILSKVRDNKLDQATIAKLNERCIEIDQENAIILCTHNASANIINRNKLAELDSESYSFYAEIKGDFPESMYPQSEDLMLKEGAQVMLTKNDIDKRYVNGSIAKVIKVSEDSITVQLAESQETINVEKADWENIDYKINKKTNEIEENIKGVFHQYPLRLAWAITIHKSQGLTFEKAILDVSHSFAHGQVYVALSRCKSLEGLYLSKPFDYHAVKIDEKILEFNTTADEKSPSLSDLEHDKQIYFKNELTELFNYSRIKQLVFNILDFANHKLLDTYPQTVKKCNTLIKPFTSEILIVSERFINTFDKIIKDNYQQDSFLQERITKGVDYFTLKINEIIIPLLETLYGLEIDNAEYEKKYERLSDELADQVYLKLHLGQCVQTCFDFSEYRKIKTATVAEIESSSRRKNKFERLGLEEKMEDIQDEDLYEELKMWRASKAKEKGLKAYMIIHNKPLIKICNDKPQNEQELIKIKGVGPKFCEDYGDEILEILHI